MGRTFMSPNSALMAVFLFVFSILTATRGSLFWGRQRKIAASLQRSQKYLGSISKISPCSPVSLVVLGHAKAATTDIYFHLLERTNGMFIKPKRKETGCYGGRFDAQTCIRNTNGPATCDWDGYLYRNLTLDAAPSPMHLPLRTWGSFHFLRNSSMSPSAVAILREPVSVMESLYNHWAVHTGWSATCHVCPLSDVLKSELKLLQKPETDRAIRKLRVMIRSGTAPIEQIKVTKDELLEGFLEFLPERCKSRDLQRYHYILQFMYILDTVYDLEILAMRQLLGSGHFTVVDFAFYKTNTDTVRDVLLEKLQGSDVFHSAQARQSFPSWESQEPKNMKSKKVSCAVIPQELKCDIAAVSNHLNQGLFETLRNLSSLNAISTLPDVLSPWWNSTTTHCRAQDR